MLEERPRPVRRYFELNPGDVEAFVSLFSHDASVLDEGKTYHGPPEIRMWRAGPAVKYTYRTEVFGTDTPSADRYLITGRLTGNFPGGTADLRWDFAVSDDLISRLVIAP